MQKDFGLAVETAERVGVKLALGETGLKVYTDKMHHERCKDLDSRVVYRFLGGRGIGRKIFRVQRFRFRYNNFCKLRIE